MILVENKQDTVDFNVEGIERDAQKVLDELDYSAFDLNILFVDDEQMGQYNRDFRNQDKPTDIISFPYHAQLKAGERIEPKGDDDRNLGDIVMAPAYIEKDLARWDMDFAQRLRVLLVHGICHLLGYDHVDDKDHGRMQVLEDKLLKIL